MTGPPTQITMLELEALVRIDEAEPPRVSGYTIDDMVRKGLLVVEGKHPATSPEFVITDLGRRAIDGWWAIVDGTNAERARLQATGATS